MKTLAAAQLPLPRMGGIAGFYEARTDRVLCVRCAGRPALAGTPILGDGLRGDGIRAKPEADCGNLHHM